VIPTRPAGGFDLFSLPVPAAHQSRRKEKVIVVLHGPLIIPVASTSSRAGGRTNREDGVSSKDAVAARREYYAANRERILANRREHYRRNKERLLSYSRDYYQDNKDKIRAKSKRWYDNNRDRKSDYWKQYYQAHREAVLARNRQRYLQRKAMRAAADGAIQNAPAAAFAAADVGAASLN
jgi:hypothetical protein